MADNWLTMMLTGDGDFGVEKNKRGEGKTPFGGRIALNASPTFCLPAQSVPRREFCFRSCSHKAYAPSQSPTARNAGHRWYYAVPRNPAQIGNHFGGAKDSRSAKVHSRSVLTEGLNTRTDMTGTGSKQKNTDRQTLRVCLSVFLLAGLPTASDSQGGPLGQPGAPPAHPHIIIRRKLRPVIVSCSGQSDIASGCK